MSEDSGNLGGTVNLCSPSPSTFRPLCPYSPSSSPSSHSIVSPLPDNRLPVCSPPHSSSPPCTSSPVVPSIRSCSSTPDSTSQGDHRGRGKDRGHKAMGGMGGVGGVGAVGRIGVHRLQLPHYPSMVGDVLQKVGVAGDAIREGIGGPEGKGLDALFL